MTGEMLAIPQRFLSVRYEASRYPGAPGAAGLQAGANCQRFAYQVLRHFGLTVPPFRSSDLWEDNEHTHRVTRLKALDLLLWNASPSPRGAHVGVYLGEDRAIHLSKQVGKPAVWGLETFLEYERYSFFLGAKRARQP